MDEFLGIILGHVIVGLFTPQKCTAYARLDNGAGRPLVMTVTNLGDINTGDQFAASIRAEPGQSKSAPSFSDCAPCRPRRRIQVSDPDTGEFIFDKVTANYRIYCGETACNDR